MKKSSVDKDICVFTAVCEDDSGWVDQYLREVSRLNLPFVILFDRCSQETKDKLLKHPNCVGNYQQDDLNIEFDECLKQKVFDLIPDTYKWALAWDIDETWLEDSFDLSDMEDYTLVDTWWVNLWGDSTTVRIDGPFAKKPRGKFYNLKYEWLFRYKTVNGAYLTDAEEKNGFLNVTCLHHGLMTADLRKKHKERWDRIYGKAMGSNPYGFWDYALDKKYKPLLINITEL